ncbi:hypothetical protein [Phytohabitans rumicis]|uniref:hypothetical protein n=1 Tax=Phytohabitans rumicis TaxID=1076125 RepID=UPI001564377A|nr:hypothetical protein [Phytohabitans rumicis]
MTTMRGFALGLSDVTVRSPIQPPPTIGAASTIAFPAYPSGSVRVPPQTTAGRSVSWYPWVSMLASTASRARSRSTVPRVPDNAWSSSASEIVWLPATGAGCSARTTPSQVTRHHSARWSAGPRTTYEPVGSTFHAVADGRSAAETWQPAGAMPIEIEPMAAFVLDRLRLASTNGSMPPDDIL